MASPQRLYKVVNRLIDDGEINPLSSEDKLWWTYREVCRKIRVPLPLEGKNGCRLADKDGNTLWEPYHSARRWGEEDEDGCIPYNESFPEFLLCVYEQWWGIYSPIPFRDVEGDEAKRLYPDLEFREVEGRQVVDFPGKPFSKEEIMDAAEIGIHPSDLPHYYFIVSNYGEELWDFYTRIVRNRSKESPYHFDNLEVFTQALRDVGPGKIRQYPMAVTWSEISPLMESGLTFQEALAVDHHDLQLHGVEGMSMLVQKHGIKKVIGVKEYLRYPEIADFLLETPGAIEVFDSVGFPHYKNLFFYRNRVPWGEEFELFEESRGEVRPFKIARVPPLEVLKAYRPDKRVVLSRKEMIRLLDGEYSSPSDFISEILELEWVEKIGLSNIERRAFLHHHDRFAVYEWIAAKKYLPAFSTLREWRDNEGTLIESSCERNFDEIRGEYLVNGKNTSINVVLDQLIKAAFEERKKKFEKKFFPIFPPFRLPPLFDEQGNRKPKEEIVKDLERVHANWTKFPQVHQLKTSDDLVQEGNRMRHCVGSSSYIDSSSCGRYFIFHIDSPSGGSTATLEGGSTLYHKAVSNKEPSQEEKDLWKEFCKYFGF